MCGDSKWVILFRGKRIKIVRLSFDILLTTCLNITMKSKFSCSFNSDFEYFHIIEVKTICNISSDSKCVILFRGKRIKIVRLFFDMEN